MNTAQLATLGIGTAFIVVSVLHKDPHLSGKNQILSSIWLATSIILGVIQ